MVAIAAVVGTAVEAVAVAAVAAIAIVEVAMLPIVVTVAVAVLVADRWPPGEAHQVAAAEEEASAVV